MRKFLFRVLEETKTIRINSKAGVPGKAGINPILMPLFISSWNNEELHLHLFKFTGTEDEVSWCNFITERFTYLTDTKWRLLPRSLSDVIEVDKDSLSCLRAKVGKSALIFDCAKIGFEKSGELLRLGELPLVATVRTINFIHRCRRATILRFKAFFKMICAVALMTFRALCQRIGKCFNVSRCFPDFASKNDA